MRRFRDGATEFDLTRLTDPSKASAILPAPPLRAVSSRNNFLLYCSDRSGSMQAWRMDLKSGENRQWTEAESLNPRAVSLTRDEKSLVYLDGNQLVVLGSKPRVAYTNEPGWKFASGFTLSDDGTSVAVSEHRLLSSSPAAPAGRYRLRAIHLGRNAANTLFEADEPLRYIRFRPKQSAILYNHRGQLTLVNPDGRGSRRLNIADGEAGEALWSADGEAIHYLSIPRERGRLVQLREYLPDTNEDKLIGSTSQFSSFARNSDSTVFAGVSGSKAGPFLLLLVRSARRELTLAEHRASSPDRAVVTFSPDSQRLFWGTDREGKPAIYSMALERFVERTEMEESR